MSNFPTLSSYLAVTVTCFIPCDFAENFCKNGRNTFRHEIPNHNFIAMVDLEKELMAWFTRTRQRKLHKRRNIFLDIKYGTELNMLDLLDHHIRLKPQSQTMFLIKQGIKISQCLKNTKKSHCEENYNEICFKFNEMLIFGAKIKILGEFIINDFFAVKHKMRGFWWFFQPLWKRFWQAYEHVTQFYNMALYFIFY